MKKCQVGGQAVLEGVMMRGNKGIATAVRKPNGEIEVEFESITPNTKKKKILSVPIVRGFVTLVDSLVVGVKSLKFSASFFEDTEPSKFEDWFRGKFGQKSDDILMAITFMISFVIAICIFVAVPTGITFFLKRLNFPIWSLNVIEGIISIFMLLSYMYLIGKMEDIQRTFMYHGAEHKTIFCYENEEELTSENVKKHSRFHPRCGTNFLLLVALVSIFIFSFTKWTSIIQRIGVRIILLPVVSGITYEIIKWLGKSEGRLAKMVATPGLKLQKLTTREPDDLQIEVAITALKAAEGIKEKQKTVGELLKWANEELLSVEIDTYILDSQLLLCKVLGKDKIWIITNRNFEVDSLKETEFREIVSKRRTKIPMQYILGTSEFMGLDFFVKEGVLIPRGDTEILVEEVLKRIDENQTCRLCDLCCGSGAIGLSLVYYRKNIKVDLIDIDRIPEEVTNINRDKLNLKDRTRFIKSDLFKEVRKESIRYEMIVSNPPYIREDIIPTLMEDVKNYEPHLALSGGEDGLDFYRKIITESIYMLINNGILAFEIGHDQGDAVKELMEKSGYKNVTVIKDLASLDRVVIGQLILDNNL